MPTYTLNNINEQTQKNTQNNLVLSAKETHFQEIKYNISLWHRQNCAIF